MKLRGECEIALVLLYWIGSATVEGSMDSGVHDDACVARVSVLGGHGRDDGGGVAVPHLLQ